MIKDAKQHPRRGNTLRRVLALIDVLAGYRRPHRVEDIAQALNDKLGTAYCVRTIHRDLIVLDESGLIDRTGATGGGYYYRLNLRSSEPQQRAAIEIDG